MDELLQARKMASAKFRRQRMEEYQRQKDLELQDHLRRRKLEYTAQQDTSYSSDELDSQDDTSSIQTFESSLRTPEDSCSPEIEQIQIHLESTPRTYTPPSRSSSLPRKSSDDNGTIRERPTSIIKPKMLASLTTTCDWNYSRFSVVMDSPQIIPSEELSSDEEEDEICTPIEIAKPIAYSLPKARPAMVSITSSGSISNSQALTINKTRLSQSMKSHKRQSSSRSTMDESKEGFLASEAKSVDYPDQSLRSQTASPILSNEFDNQRLPASISPKRKSSMPLLFAAARGGHSRMNSIKNFIRSSTYGSMSTSSNLGDISEEKPRRQIMEQRPEIQRSQTDNLLMQRSVEYSRPQTARAPIKKNMSLRDLNDFPQPPSSPHSPIESNAPIMSPSPEQTLAARRKSFSKLRQRSGSIGQALKINLKPKVPDFAAMPSPGPRSTPSMPLLRTTSSVSNLVAEYYSSGSVPLTPKDPRRSMAMYSPFPGSTNDHRFSGPGLARR